MFNNFKLNKLITSIFLCFTLLFSFNMTIFAENNDILKTSDVQELNSSQNINTTLDSTIQDNTINIEQDVEQDVEQDDKGREDDGEAAAYFARLMHYDLAFLGIDAKWDPGTLPTSLDSLLYHYTHHRNDRVLNRKYTINNIKDYYNAALSFRNSAPSNINSSPWFDQDENPRFPEPGRKYVKDGIYIIVSKSTGRILSFGGN